MKLNHALRPGSQAWIDNWVEFYWHIACINTDRYAEAIEPHDRNTRAELAMFDMFMSLDWADRKPRDFK